MTDESKVAPLSEAEVDRIAAEWGSIHAISADDVERLLDIALAHARQTADLAAVPTADAYEAACKALQHHRERADKAEADLDAARAEAAALAAALREACVTLRSAAELREDIRDAYARHLRDVSERGNTVLADAGAAGERVQTLIQAARTIIITGSGEPHIVRWHPGADTRETVDVPLDQVRALSAALAALSAPAPARPDGEEGRADD